MKKRERLAAVHVLLLALGILLLGGFGYFVFASLGRKTWTANFERVLRSADGLIASGANEDAFALLSGIGKFPPSGRARLSFLKRLREVSLRLGRGNAYAEAAERAARDFPRNHDLAAEAVLAFIDAGRVGEAADLAEKRLSGGERRDVYEEALLRAGREPSGKAAGDLLFAGLPFSRRPADFLKAAESSGLPDLYLDAALLLLEAGSPEEASRILLGGAGEKFPLAAAAALYDAGRYEESAGRLLLLKPEEQLRPFAAGLEADVLMRTGAYDKAESRFRYLMDAYPGLSPVPYLNAAFIARRTNPRGGTDLLRRAFDIFPRDERPFLALAKAYTAAGMRAEASELLRTYGVLHPDGADRSLLLLLAEKDPSAARGFASSLWVLRSSYPDSPSIPAVLSGVLFSLADDDGLRDLLGSVPEDFRSAAYAALLDLRAGNSGAAAAAFRRIAAAYPDRPEAHFNHGLVLSAAGDHKAALESFRTASESPAADRMPDFRLRCALRIAGEYSALRAFPEAHRTLKNILAGEPENPEALRKLRKLEGLPES